jgi:hypothetical protein
MPPGWCRSAARGSSGAEAARSDRRRESPWSRRLMSGVVRARCPAAALVERGDRRRTAKDDGHTAVRRASSVTGQASHR